MDANNEHPASVHSSRTGETDRKPDAGNVEEAEHYHFKEARALLGKYEYPKGNIEAALHVFEGIDIASVTPKIKITLAKKGDTRKRHSQNYGTPPISIHAVSLLLESIYLKAKSLQALGRHKVVTELRDSDPACLCYIIEQVHNGSNAVVKSMGVQESRLLQLASACNVANASVTECPRLLHLAPNSPHAAIFNNASRASATTPVPQSGTPSASSSTPSQGFWRRPQVGESIAVSLVVFLFAFKSGVP